MSDVWTPTRAAGLERIEAFQPRMGRAYSAGRNTDFGPGHQEAASQLSPWVRRRLVTEEEVARAALEAHGPRGGEVRPGGDLADLLEGLAGDAARGLGALSGGTGCGGGKG